MKSVADSGQRTYVAGSERQYLFMTEDYEELDRFVYTGKSGWPFPITNGARNTESQLLLDAKQKPAKIKPDLTNEQDALI